MAGQLGHLEFAILATLLRYPEGTYGAKLHETIEAAGRRCSIGALYTTLDRMERKGLLRSRWGEPTAERGGRRKRFFEVTAAGEAASRETAAERGRFTLGGVVAGEA